MEYPSHTGTRTHAHARMHKESYNPECFVVEHVHYFLRSEDF